jgi:hypothetical protein
MFVLLLATILLTQAQTPSPPVKTENPVVKNKPADQRKNTIKHQEPRKPNSRVAVSTTESTVQSTTKEGDHQDKPQGGVYMIHEVSPPEAKHAPPLFVPYLIATIVGVVVNAFILILIWRQSIATERSAFALVASERAWIHAELVWSETESRHEPDESEDFLFCSLLYSNRGKTLCWIFEKSIHVVVAANIDRLPKEPRFENDIYTQRVYETEPIYPDTPQRESRFKPKRPNKGREEMLFIYGVIKYRDVFMSGSGYKETRFGYMTKDLFKLERMIGHYEYNKNT